MNHNETLAAMGFAPQPAETVRDAAPAVGELPTRRSLRAAREAAASVAPVPVAPSVATPVPFVFGLEASATVAPAAAAPAATPAFAAGAPADAADAAAQPRRRLRRRTRTPRLPLAERPLVSIGTARTPSRQRLTAAGTMVIVGGLFASLALPAYASQDFATAPVALAEADSVAAKAAIGAQVLAIDEGVALADTTEARDTYESISATELKAFYRDGLRQQNLSAYLASGAKELGDDYPYAAELTRPQGGGLSPFNYYYRECVDFVVWRLNRDAGSTKAPYKYTWSTLTPGAGSARSWKRQWENHGWEISTTPQPGWVAWFPGGNHVSYVTAVLSDGSVLIEEYNWGPHVYGQRIIPVTDALYLAPPPR